MSTKSNRIFIIFLVILVTSVFLYGSLNAQVRGRLTGRISDAGSGDYLPGANVMLKGTTFGDASDRAGIYSIENIPPGTYNLTVSYIGYEEFSTEVRVTAGRTEALDVALQISQVEMEEVVVTGLRQGQRKALSQQRTAANIKNIVADEQMQRFPDLNTAEVMQRIPGISITRDQGEGRYVLVRGTEARLNAMSVNGERIASPENEERFVGLDAISAAQVASIEVTKANTPDMDADAIGGSVNMVTRSAFDSDKRIFRLSLGSGYGDLMGKPLYQGDFVYANQFGKNNNIGLTVSANWYQSNRGSHNNEMEWGSEDDVNDVEIPFALRNLELRDYTVSRDRYGFTSNLEYLHSPEHKFFLRGMLNIRDDVETRNRLRIRPEKGDYNDATHISEASLDRELKDRLEKQKIFNTAFGGKSKFGRLGVDYTFSYSYAEEEKPDQTDPAFDLNEDANLTLDLSNPDTPKYITNLGSDYIHNPDNWELDEIVREEKGNTDSDIMGSLNFSYPYLLGDNAGELKFGGKLYMKNKERTNTVWEYGWEGDDDILLSQLTDKNETSDFLDGAYRIGPGPSSDKVRSFFKEHRDELLEGEINHEDSDAENYKAKENIYAYYGMTTLNFGNMMVLAGFRHEITSVDYTGNEVLFDVEGDYETTKEVANESSYSHFFPMLHLRYRMTPRTNLRAAFTSGIARPNYYDLVPYRIVLREDDEMAMGNPDLEPTFAYNFDLLAEHYLRGIGVISGGFFYKTMDNIIYTSFYDQVGGTYDGFEVEQKVNGETASLYGFEVNWQQQLTFLPGVLSGLGIYTNYTYTKSKADLPDRTNIDLPGQAGNVGNFAISFEKFGFTGRLSLNYHGSYVDEVGKDEDHDIYYDDHMQLDFSASQRITGGLRFYLEAINLTNEPLRYYMGTEDRPVQREFYSWWMHAGFKYSF